MKKIKNKILISYSIAGILVIGIIGAMISLKLDEGLAQQSQILSDELTALINKNLAGQHNIFKAKIRGIGEIVEDLSGIIARDHRMAEAIEGYQITRLNGILESFRDKMDFAAIFNLEGKHIASYPADVDVLRIEQFFESWKLREWVHESLRNDTGGKGLQLIALSKHEADFTKAFRLTDRNFAGSRLISIASAAIIRNDFKDPIGIEITGRVLNNYEKPLREIYDATDLACAVYLGNTPIVHKGFDTKEEDASKELQISDEMLSDIYSAGGIPKPVVLKIAGQKYQTVCSAITASDSQKIGVICVGMPERQVLDIKNAMILNGRSSMVGLQAWIMGIGLVCILLFVAISLVIAIRIEHPIRGVVTGLSDAALTVASAAHQIALTSVELADGASEQSAAAEESAASLTQMTETSRETSGLTHGAGELMNSNIKKSVKTVKSLVELTAKVALIEKDSGQIGKIIKTINDIAFQTNLLALNAAVEAARAGDAGAGFAVVANEVRNLSVKVKNEARMIQRLLDITIERISESAVSIKNMNNDFEGIVKSATVMGDKTQAITHASKELAITTQQISDTITEMGNVIQKNAANAEEFAGSSEELNAQAEQLKVYVKTLNAMI